MRARLRLRIVIGFVIAIAIIMITVVGVNNGCKILNSARNSGCGCIA